ncbi:hypothetical protein JD844_019701 [Phrynosoma platyrhinos]|uniref:Protein kinase domain-containing protein n=1 Tax=Phrynosoma platyrhinos TaxID=52577 RepID=A0ABQ7TPW5_PHRPL|nr:hypothetical protein JD844_019701 [Phrynosoma platyrhinos]
MKGSRGGRKRSLPGPEGGDAPAAAKKGARMVNFCPQCGQRVETVFNFCPSCGGRLPTQEEEPMQIAPTPSLKGLSQEVQDQLQRLPAEKKVHLFLPDEEKASASVKQGIVQTSAVTLSPKAKAKLSSRSPRKDRSAFVRPLPEGQILTDLNDKQWILKKLLSQNDHGMIYEAKSASGACPPKQRYTLKLDCKEGKIFNEQNFLQRAAKKVAVQESKEEEDIFITKKERKSLSSLWKRTSNISSLFFLWTQLYDLHPLQALSTAYVYELDVLEYLHENEYTHGDIAAENIYVNPADLTAVTLADYCFAFRYSPGGKHVSQREGSRTPHEGNLEFISLDSHKGAAPSRRSDLESLGYCLVKWLCGCLPWSEDLANPCAVMEKKERYKADVIKHPRLSYGWKAIPEALQSYLLQVMPLEYDEKPNYEELRMLLRKPLQLMRTDAYDSMDLRVAP